MPSTVKVYRHGLSVGFASSKKPQPVQRGQVNGWSLDSSRSNTRFLWSVDQEKLTGVGIACTLTVRHCPPSHAEWKAKREAFIARQRRRGLIRLHWLTEMQWRGVPHLHICAYYDPDRLDIPLEFKGRLSPERFLQLVVPADWLTLTAEWGSGPGGQDAKPITDAEGWLEYLAKHGARGQVHYQRCKETLPDEWRGVTGRMWGKVGGWPTSEPIGLELDMPGFFRLRRLMRSYRVAKARVVSQARKRSRALLAARRCLRCSNPKAAPFRGVSGWVPESVSLAMVAFLAASGAVVQC
jgi:hypothetical protein